MGSGSGTGDGTGSGTTTPGGSLGLQGGLTSGGAGRYLGPVALAPATRLVDMSFVDAAPVLLAAPTPHSYLVLAELRALLPQ